MNFTAEKVILLICRFILNLQVFISLRYFITKRNSGGVNASNIITWISMAGYVAGAAALIIVLSVFNGFELLFTGMFTNFDADLRIKPATGKYFSIKDFPVYLINNHQQVAAYSFITEENALLHYSNKQTIATIKGVDKNYLKTISLQNNITAGELLLQSGDTNYAILGQHLAYQLGVDPTDPFNILGIYVPKSGKVDMMNPDNAFARGYLYPAGVFAVQDEVDSKYVIVPLRLLSKLLQKEPYAGMIDIKLKADADLKKVQNQLKQQISNKFKVINRFEQHESFYKVMKSEKVISFIILSFILMVAAFNTVGSLYMLVIEKKRDLFIFKSMGLTPAKGAGIFLIQGIFIALTGGLAGVVIGATVCYIQQVFGIVALHSNGSYVVNTYPVSLHFNDCLLVFLTILALGLITAWYPALKAYRMLKEN